MELEVTVEFGGGGRVVYDEVANLFVFYTIDGLAVLTLDWEDMDKLMGMAGEFR